jgi:hypothetical protein
MPTASLRFSVTVSRASVVRSMQTADVPGPLSSPVIAGNLTHRDSLNNVETLKRGDLQMTSTGTGIRHS